MLTITTTHHPATDLGYLLHKHPDKLQTFPLPFGNAHVFYPEAQEDTCTVALMLEVDPVRLTRRGNAGGSNPFLLQEYVNDRPYSASSHLSVAIAKVFRTAMSGRCEERPHLAASPIPLTARVASVRSRHGTGLIHRLFTPLGYQVETVTHPMDPSFPDWGPGYHHDVLLESSTRTLAELLTHIYVLLPVMDNQKHYWISQDEIEKLLRFGEGWLPSHPERDIISRRYLGNRRNLTGQARERLDTQQAEQEQQEDQNAEAGLDSPASSLDTAGPEEGDNPADPHEQQPQTSRMSEEDLEKYISLNELRIQEVTKCIRQHQAQSVLDLGCGEGQLIRALMPEPTVTSITGVEVSLHTIEVAQRRLRVRDMNPEQRRKLTLLHGSLLYRDPRLQNADAAVAMEVIEHIDLDKLHAFEDAVMGGAKPKLLIITTPNQEYNVLFPNFTTTFRHRDHRFEWTRQEFQDWAQTAAARQGYTVEFQGIGNQDDELGAPTQMAVFSREEKHS